MCGFLYQKIPVIKISIPIAIRIIPPKIDALPESFVPNFLPMRIPQRQIRKVTAAISAAHTAACVRL